MFNIKTTPNVLDVFASFYNQNTYLPPQESTKENREIDVPEKTARSRWHETNTLDLNAERNLMAAMAAHIANVAHSLNISDVVVIQGDSHSKDQGVLSTPDTLKAFRSMEGEQQKKLAQTISQLVIKAGIADASFTKIRLTKEHKIAFVDVLPLGLMTPKKSGFWNSLFPSHGASIEKCGRIGIRTLYAQISESKTSIYQNFESNQQQATPGFDKGFFEVIAKEHESGIKKSKGKIALAALSLGLIPLVQLIASYVIATLSKRAHDKLKEMELDSSNPHSTKIKPVDIEKQQKVYDSIVNNIPY